MTEPARLSGRSIHVAAHAMRTLRNSAVGKAGLTFPQWAAIEAVATAPSIDRHRLIHKLVELTVDDEAGSAKAIDELHERDLVTTRTDDQGNLELTTSGKALHQQVNATKTDLHHQLFDDIPAEDLATTERVLDLITERANAAHTGQ